MTTQPATTIATTPTVRKRDPIVTAYQADVGVVDRLRACQEALALLVVELEWLEQHADEIDDIVEAGRAVSRRMRAIKSIVKLELDVQAMRGEPEPDIRSPLARRVFSALLNEIEHVVRDMVAADTADAIVTAFMTRVEGEPDIPWP